MREELLLAVLELTVGLGICVGCVAVYVPQHVACWRHRTAIGLSLGTILLGTLSQVALILTRVVADSDTIVADYYHIHHHHESQADDDRTLQILNMLNAAMPTLQLVVAMCTGIPTFAVYYFYFGHEQASTVPQQRQQQIQQQQQQQQQQQANRWEVLATGVTWLVCGTATAVSLWILFVLTPEAVSSSHDPDHDDDNDNDDDDDTHHQRLRLLHKLVRFWSGTAVVTKAVQWLPQIERTWTTGHEGVVSGATLTMAVVGNILLLLLARVWWHPPRQAADNTTPPYWIGSGAEHTTTTTTTPTDLLLFSSVVDAVMQFVLLVLVRHYQRQRNRHGLEEGRDPDNAGRTMEHHQQQQQQPRGPFLREDATHRHDNFALRRPLLDEEEEANDDGETTQAQGNRGGSEGCERGMIPK